MIDKNRHASTAYEANGITNTLEIHHVSGERFATITRRRHAGTNRGGTYLREATEQIVVDVNELAILLAAVTQ